MIIEYIRYRVPGERRDEFEAAYGAAASSLQRSPHCFAYDLARGVEEPERYILRIEWDSREGHEQGFRGGEEFRAFFAAVRPFFDDIEEMSHYEATPIVGDGGGARS
jgi:quinol monooxygenase YgiN